MQARNFLSDEDVCLSKKYRNHHWEIECLLRTLSDEKLPCNSVLFRQVRDMLRVHRARMDRVDYPIAEQVDPRRLAHYSTRLPTQDPTGIQATRHSLRKEDHAPFTIDRKPDHAHFVQAFRSNDKTGQRLREVERGAYFQTLKDPGLISEYLTDNTYEERALKRGRRRAALQLALRAIGGNEEQMFEGGWMQRVVSLPQPPSTRAEEPRMCQGLSESERPAEPDRFWWTKRNIKFQQGQEQLLTWVNDERAQNRASLRGADPALLAQLPTKPVVFYKPTQKQSIVVYRRERRIARLAQVAFGIVARVSYDHISDAIKDGQTPSSPEAQVIIAAHTQGLIDSQANNTGDVPTAAQIVLLQQYAKTGGQLLQHEHDGDVAEIPLDNAQLNRLEACSVNSLSEPDDDTRILLRTLRVELVDLVNEANTGIPTNENENDRQLDKATLKTFREDVVGASPAQTAGKQFLSLEELANPSDTIRILPVAGNARGVVADRILTENNEDVRDRSLEHSKIWSFSTTLPEDSKVQNHFSMEKWPRPSRPVPNIQAAIHATTDKRKATTALETTPATKRSRYEYTTQANGGKCKATSDPETAPAPKRSANVVDYPSLDPTDSSPSRRLAPNEMGFQVVKERSADIIPLPGTGDLMPPEIKDFDVKRHGQVLENAPDPKEKRLKGKARFPFGETSTTAVAMNNQIGLEMGGSKLFLVSRQLHIERITNIDNLSPRYRYIQRSRFTPSRRPQALYGRTNPSAPNEGWL